MIECGKIIIRTKVKEMTEAFPRERAAKRKFLLDAVDSISKTLRASSARSEEVATLAPEAVDALVRTGMFRLKLAEEMGGAEADPVTEMLVLEALAYHDLTSGWCTMIGATAIASLGTFLPPTGLKKVFKNGRIPTAAISSFPTKDVTMHDNWGGVVGLRGTGSCDFSIENYQLPEDLTFVWDLLKPKPRRGGPSYLFPPFSYVAKEHGSVAIGAARRALDELIALATTTRGTFRSSRLDERQVVHRFIGQADLKLRAARALMHERYDQMYDGVSSGKLPDGAAIADVRAICLHATDVAIETATMCYHFAGNTGLHHPHVLGRLLRDLNTAGLHQVMSDTAYENHGKFRLGLPADPLA